MYVCMYIIMCVYMYLYSMRRPRRWRSFRIVVFTCWQFVVVIVIVIGVYCDCFGSFAARVVEFAHASGRPYLLHTMCTCCLAGRWGRWQHLGASAVKSPSYCGLPTGLALLLCCYLWLPGLPGCNPFSRLIPHSCMHFIIPDCFR